MTRFSPGSYQTLPRDIVAREEGRSQEAWAPHGLAGLVLYAHHGMPRFESLFGVLCPGQLSMKTSNFFPSSDGDL